MFKFFNKRNYLSKQEATRVTETILPVYLERYPGLFPVKYATILYKSSESSKNCWILWWNSKRYAKTGVFSDQWLGPGPIIVDKWTGNVRIYPSGHNMEQLLYDYDQDVLAAGKAWVLFLQFDPLEQSAVLSQLQSTLRLNFEETAKLAEKLPGPLFTGRRRCLEWVATKLREVNLSCLVVLGDPAVARNLEWVHFPWMYHQEFELSEGLEASRDYPEVHGGWRNFREFACPIPEIVERYGTPFQRAFKITEEDEKAQRREMFDQAVIAGHSKAVLSLVSWPDVDVNRRITRANGDTALLIAAHRGEEELTKILLLYGADTERKDSKGRTALDIAEENGYIRIVELLQER